MEEAHYPARKRAAAAARYLVAEGPGAYRTRARRCGHAFLFIRHEAPRRARPRDAERLEAPEGETGRRGLAACRDRQRHQGGGEIERPEDASARHAAAPDRHRPDPDAVDRRGAGTARARDGPGAARAASGSVSAR